MSLGNTRLPSTQSTDTREGVEEKHPSKIEIVTNTWVKTPISIQRFGFNWSRMQPEHQDGLYSPGDTKGSQG